LTFDIYKFINNINSTIACPTSGGYKSNKQTGSTRHVRLISQSINDFDIGLSNQACHKVCQSSNSRTIAGTEKIFCSWCRNESTDNAETTLSSSAFQIWVTTATGKAQLPRVD